ncbi:MAG TPA: PEGA domain-containing protein, partial [Candidatus Binataceae bacterium]|nr:PEGA domain-containing protein [Candidatus Binataceae bacterium]
MKNGSTQQIDFQSEPAGAQVVVNGKQYGPTPTSATLSRCETYEVTVEKTGYEPDHITISRGESGID